ncbi:hypothetical protein LNKW23_15060 [Paralimibaculum aggregatum]|uniref:Uncharacterized protein n=1 Tax=Paralimibaculum aggregatum TaxID=3036245 RepID=A0ABQ6LG41_9RHOB|nr:hypothetical protein [Limibaculum sp. NKW23]GMG82293.1 hypothetical protein LNKW23_15060 [Limibaculum sp. NKW23]
MDPRKIAALLGFVFGIAALASHILSGVIDADYVFGTASAAVFATYGWYHLRRAREREEAAAERVRSRLT